MYSHSALLVERPMETCGWRLTYYYSLSKMLGDGGLFSPKEEGQLKEWFQESIGGSCYFSPGV